MGFGGRALLVRWFIAANYHITTPKSKQVPIIKGFSYTKLNYMENKMRYWRRQLGFKPDKTFEPECFDSKCYNCESNAVDILSYGSWSRSYRCHDCGCYTYVVFTDRMSGVYYDNVAVSKQYSHSF